MYYSPYGSLKASGILRGDCTPATVSTLSRCMQACDGHWDATSSCIILPRTMETYEAPCNPTTATVMP